MARLFLAAVTVFTPKSAAASPSGCTNGQAFDNSAFTCIFYPKSDLANCAPAAPDPSAVIGMLDIFPRLQRQNVTISYQPTNLGFVWPTRWPAHGGDSGHGRLDIPDLFYWTDHAFLWRKFCGPIHQYWHSRELARIWPPINICVHTSAA